MKTFYFSVLVQFLQLISDPEVIYFLWSFAYVGYSEFTNVLRCFFLNHRYMAIKCSGEYEGCCHSPVTEIDKSWSKAY